MTVMIKVIVMLVVVSAYQIMDIKWTAHLMDVSVHINDRKILINSKNLNLMYFKCQHSGSLRSLLQTSVDYWIKRVISSLEKNI